MEQSKLFYGKAVENFFGAKYAIEKIKELNKE